MEPPVTVTRLPGAVAFDTETHRTTRSCLVPKVVCLTLSGAGDTELPPELRNNDTLVRHREDAWSAIVVGKTIRPAAEWLFDQQHIIAHRAPYDLAVLSEVLHDVQPAIRMVDEHRCHDTAPREALIEIARGSFQINRQRKSGGHHYFALAGMAHRRLGLEVTGKKDADRWQLNYHLLDGVPVSDWPQEAVDYAILDAEAADAIWLDQANDDGYIPSLGEYFIDAQGRVTDELRQFRAAFDLHLMACHGPMVGRERAEATVAEWRRLLDHGAVYAREAGFLRDNGSRDMKALQALVERVYSESGRDVEYTKPSKKFPAGQVRTARTILQMSGHTALQKWGDADEYRNYVSKYADMLLGVNGPMTSWPGTIVATGRCSWANPPLHGPPREGGFRECFEPREGFAFVSIDYSQIELVCLAYVLEAWELGSEMADRIRAGIDLHSDMATEVLRADQHDAPLGDWTTWTYELFIQCKKGKHGKAWKKVAKTYRTLAKAANFGFPGGLGAATFIKFAFSTYRLVIDLERANQLRQLWRDKNPAVVAYFGVISELCADGEFTTIQLMSERYRGGVGYCDGANTHFQGLAADGIKDASWRIRKEFYDPKSPLYGSRSWLLLHDEIIFEIPMVNLHDASMHASKIMVDTMHEYTPTIRPEAEPAAMMRWHKNAEPVYDENERLVCWEPSEEAA